MIRPANATTSSQSTTCPDAYRGYHGHGLQGREK